MFLIDFPVFFAFTFKSIMCNRISLQNDHVFHFQGGETDYPGDTFNLLRRSQDCEVYNNFGLSLIELCCEYDVHMLNGRLFDDIEGNITCTANDGRSIVDYIIASSRYITRSHLTSRQ